MSDEAAKFWIAAAVSLIASLLLAILVTLAWYLDLLLGAAIGFILVYGGTLIIIMLDE